MVFEFTKTFGVFLWYFLDTLPDTLRLEMCGNHVYGGVDATKWKRFAEHDICEISVGDQPFAYIDLSVLCK